MKRPILLFLFLAAWQGMIMQAQTSDFSHLKHRIGLDFRPAYVLPTSSFFDGENAAGKPIRTALSTHLKYAFQFDKQSEWGRLYPHAYQGIGLSYTYFDEHQVLGAPVSLYVFQGSRIAALSPALSLNYEWNFGASFGWKRHAATADTYRGIVGSKINAYINCSFLLDWRIASNWHLAVGIDLTHYSNGNTNFPNAGVNLAGARIGLVRTLGASPASDSDNNFSAITDSEQQSKITYDVLLYGSIRKRGAIDGNTPYMVPGSFGVVGLNFNPMYRINRYFRTGASLDAQYDESANIGTYYAGGGWETPKFFRPSFREQFSVGLSVRAELVMPIFSINVGMGYNVFQKGEDTKGWYQVLALKTFVTRNLFLHVGYQLSKFRDPNNLMLGLGWRF